MSRLTMIQSGLMRRGMDAVSAHAAALRALAGMVARQAQVVAFDKIFELGGLLMLTLLPLVLFLRHPATVEAEPAPAAADVEAA